VAVDLAGSEADYPANQFREVYDLAHKKGIPITIHAGEAAGPFNIHDAIIHLHAQRIGHGVRLKEDPRVLEMVKNSGVYLEMCPISNIQTKASPSWEAYPIREYFEQGLLLTVNTDNLTVSNTDLVKEYSFLVERFHFSLTEITCLIRNAAKASFIEWTEKNEVLQKLECRFAELGIA
jgi:adenosine deaminase